MTANPSDDKGRVLSANCPSRQILQHLTNRWGVLVMIALATGTKRFSEIRRDIEGISERMLTQTLQQLEQDGMVHRKSFNTVPPHVEYTLTDRGRSLKPVLDSMQQWGEHYKAAIK